MKTCTKCGIKKQIEDFRRKSSASDGRSPECRRCATLDWKRWHKTHVEKHRENARRWRINNPREYRRKKKIYRRGHPVEFAAYNKKYLDKLKFKDLAAVKKRWFEIRIKSEYGLTSEQHADMMKKQKGGCAICGGINRSGRRLHIDHDHKTGIVRGLLCNFCNNGLGSFKDQPVLLREAIAYLLRYA